MVALATLFLPGTGIPGEADLAQAASGADVTAERTGLLRRVRGWRLAWADLDLRVVLLDGADRLVRVREACRRIEEHGGGGALQRRLVDARHVLEVEGREPTADHRVASFLRGACERLDAVALLPDRIDDARGPVDRGGAAPSLQRVLRRLLVTQALVARGHLEREEFEGRAEEPGRIVAWLQRQGAGEEWTADERETLLRGPGLLDDAQVRALTWKAEALAVLAWSLGATRLPPHDQLANPYELVGGLGFLSEMLHPALLVPEPKGGRECAAMRAEIGEHHARLVQGDPTLRVRGIPLDRAPDEVVELARNIAEQRRAAIDWVCGG